MAINFKNVSILVAEDNRAISQIIHAVLEELGFGSITMAIDGDKAFEAFCESKHDLIISDWEMEPASGIDFLHNVRYSPLSPDPQVPFIFITGYAAPKRVIEARDKGMTEFIVKPFSVDQMVKRISYIVNKPRDFVDVDNFRGPDRRRARTGTYSGEERRTATR